MPKRPAAGYVLAGGRSSRMGTDKATLPFRGGTLLDHVARAVAGAAGSVAIVGGSGGEGWRAVADAVQGFGPVAGIVAALEDTEAEWTLIVACDMPCVSRDWLRQLLGCAAGQVLIPRTPDGHIHPLCAVWHISARSVMHDALTSGVHTVREAIRALDCRWYDLADARPVRNVNTPEEWAQVWE
jgi:molybdenum cofactor guanylyltransferase